MAEDTRKFSHISVSADDEDDVVIVAGAPNATAPSIPAAVSGARAKQPAAGEKPASDEAGAQAAPRQAPEKPSAESAHSTEKGSYKETTLDDLESSKMSTMQKAIVAVALIAIVAFAVYYMVLR